MGLVGGRLYPWLMGSNKQKLSQEEVEALFLRQGLQVLEPYINSRTRIKSRCISCGKIVEPYYRQIWAGQRGCRDCSSSNFKLDQEDISITLDRYSLKLVGNYKNSKTTVDVECVICKSMSSVIIGRLRAKGTFQCRVCHPNRSFFRKNKFTDSDIQIISNIFLEYGFELIGEYLSASKPTSVMHLTCRTISDRSLKSIKNGAGFCKGCTKNRIITEEEAIGILDKAGFIPLGKYVNGETPWEAQCKKCGRILRPTLHTLKGKKSGCSYCNKVKIDPSDAVALMVSAGFIPLEPYKNSKARWKSRHTDCGKIVYPQYNSIYNGQGCSECGDTYSYNEPSYFYVLENHLFQSLKVGISNCKTRDDRVAVHAKHGWRLVQRIDFENGYLAFEFEQTLLNYIREFRGIPSHMSKSDMPQGGYSETMSLESISVSELLRIVRENQLGNLAS